MNCQDQDLGHRFIPGARVRVASEQVRVSMPFRDHPLAEPQIILIREGDAVKAIEVVCKCGERIRMNCVF